MKQINSGVGDADTRHWQWQEGVQEPPSFEIEEALEEEEEEVSRCETCLLYLRKINYLNYQNYKLLTTYGNSSSKLKVTWLGNR